MQQTKLASSLVNFRAHYKIVILYPFWPGSHLELCAAAAAPPPPTECRRRAGAVFVTCSRHVVRQLYVATFLYSNAVYNEASTLTESKKKDAGVFCNSPWYSNEIRRRQSKVFSWTVLWKWKLMLKVSYGNSVESGLIKRMVQWKISTACTVGLITAYKVVK